jgi:sortase A
MLKNISITVLILAGLWQFGSGSYIYLKAQLAQHLLHNAWSKSLQNGANIKPWAWADTYPVAKIKFHHAKKDYIVLAGGTGRTMAFGPGHISATPLPGNGGNSVFVGHRDTHFTVLSNLKLGDVISVQTPYKELRYNVADTFIVDQSQTEVIQDFGSELLTLITCYPFDAIHSGGRLRYVLQAVPI